MRIVVIEDDEDLLGLISAVLIDEGHEVVPYMDKNSIKGIIINRPDLVLLDHKLPDGLGSDLCYQIKSNELTKHVAVILTSGIPDLNKVAKECGADAYLEKPFDLNTMTQLVNEQAIRHAHVTKHEDFG
jgi:two-component system phosphate regulon response regulator PhoB